MKDSIIIRSISIFHLSVVSVFHEYREPSEEQEEYEDAEESEVASLVSKGKSVLLQELILGHLMRSTVWLRNLRKSHAVKYNSIEAFECVTIRTDILHLLNERAF